MELKQPDYSIQYDPATATILCRGSLRLDGLEAYRPVLDILEAAAEESEQIIVDLQELEFLNSSGISMLSMFVVRLRQRGTAKLTFKGSANIVWQTRSLKNLQRLMPSIELVLT
ncbi:MAG: hypothetical protein BJG00_002110 [Limnothrix sp. CACIAM 69d]|uniref:STAS domain-containing protein n=1 Tax=Limnothrix redekei LRLZ20PSL1 TaxID=3112953 RepID=A0ABW7C4V6_9CYAN|nr:MAG: hypothetical protein BJG00_002110 [Limnothrix sp. CACIAM 69d]